MKEKSSKATNSDSIKDKYPPDKYPIDDGIYNFADNNQDFHQSLKLFKLDRFVLIPGVFFISHTPPGHPKCNDVVIGMFYYDTSPNICRYHNRRCKFKQDFIVNVNGESREFISYSSFHSRGQYVKSIDEFFDIYGENGRYYYKGDEWHHHYRDIEDLPDDIVLKEEARKIQIMYEGNNDV